MKSLALLASLTAALTFCNLTEKLTLTGGKPQPANSGQLASNVPAKQAPDRRPFKNGE